MTYIIYDITYMSYINGSVQYQSSKQVLKIIICRIIAQFYTKKLYFM